MEKVQPSRGKKFSWVFPGIAKHIGIQRTEYIASSRLVQNVAIAKICRMRTPKELSILNVFINLYLHTGGFKTDRGSAFTSKKIRCILQNEKVSKANIAPPNNLLEKKTWNEQSLKWKDI